MAMTREEMLGGMYRRDQSLNGRYVAAVTSTGIYCLPCCPARKPRPERVVFFLRERDALAAGYRPCKRCRPDAYYRGEPPELATLEALVAEVREQPARYVEASALTQRSGYGATKLTALLRRHFHCSPAGLLQAARITRARMLLAEGATPIEASLASGYASSSAFYRNFVRLTGLTPGEYRRLDGSREFVLRLPADYPATHTLGLLGRDAASPCEQRRGTTLLRALQLAGGPAGLRLELRGGSARCRLEAERSLGPAETRQAHEVAVRLLGLASEPEPFLQHLERLPRGLELVDGRRGLRLVRFATAFEAAAWAIIGQQINLAFAFRLRAALIERCGRAAPGGLRTHPDPAAVARLDYADLTRSRYSRRKAEYLIDLARHLVERDDSLERLADCSATRARVQLLALRGIGPWTADYLLMRGLGFSDCLPIGDAGLVQALRGFHGLGQRPDAAQTAELMAPYAPYRSFAVSHFWARLTAPARAGAIDARAAD